MQRIDPASDPRALRGALGRFATGVTVITAWGADGRAQGITANSFASVSLDPPLVLWCPSRASRRYDTFAGAASFAIHVLAHDQLAVCDAFVRAEEGFAVVPREPGDGPPLIGGCLARLTCDRESVTLAGDHALVLGRVRLAEVRDGAPLVFHGGRYGGFDAEAFGHPAPEGEP